LHHSQKCKSFAFLLGGTQSENFTPDMRRRGPKHGISRFCVCGSNRLSRLRTATAAAADGNIDLNVQQHCDDHNPYDR
jgi:hypothetical protein